MPSNIWFTADTHLNSPGIIRCRPQFNTYKEHDEYVIERWNSVITPSDRVYLLGDVGSGRPEDLRKLLDRLNSSQVFCILGNHDQTTIKPVVRSRFVWQKGVHHLKIGEQKMWLGHFPYLTWSGMYRGEFSLHGHCHNNLPDNLLLRRMDVGLDTNDLIPWSWDEISNRLSIRPFVTPELLGWVNPV